MKELGLKAYVEEVHELSHVPAKALDEPPRQHRSNGPQDPGVPHIRDPVRRPLDGVDGSGFEAVRRLLDQPGGAREGELGNDLGGQGPERVVRVDAVGALAAQPQDLLLHDLVLVVDEALELEDAGAGEHVVHHLAPLAVELRVVLPKDGLVGVEGIVEPGVLEVLGSLAVDDLVEADVVEMEFVGSDAKSTCICRSVSRFCDILN